MKRQEYRQRKPVLFNAEQNVWEAFQDLCDKERKSISLKLNEMLSEEIQKNPIGENHNHIGIEYVSHSSAKRKDNNTLDHFIDKHCTTIHDFIQEFKPIDDQDKLAKYANMGICIAKAAGNVRHFKQTGKFQAL